MLGENGENIRFVLNEERVMRLQQRKIQKYVIGLQQRKIQKYVMKLQHSKSQKYVTE